jgi:cytoskeletal protein CcmA (bactofilin family)
VRRLPVPIAAVLTALLLAAPAGAAPATSEKEEAIVVINGDVTVSRGEVVEGVFIVDGDAVIAGRVDGDVALVAGDALVSGRIDGNLVPSAGRARLLPRASVGGDLTYGDEEPLIARGATVEGEINEEEWTDFGLLPLIGFFALWLAVTVSAAILGILLLLLSPRAADAVFEQARTRFWTAIGIGAGIFVAIPIAIFVAAITLLGLPLAIGLGLATLPFAAIAYVTAAWALGRRIVGPPQGRILAFLVGLAILRVAALLPILGLLVGLAAVIAGLGLLGGAIAAAREARAAPGQAGAGAPGS